MRFVSSIFLCVAVAAPAAAQLNVPSEGWDGELLVTDDTVVDLRRAHTGDWATDPAGGSWAAGDGIYDPDQWAVVFHYTNVTIDAGESLEFANHPSGAPVVWLVSGDVTIDGALDLSGTNADASGYPGEPGPGGFRGGNGTSLSVDRGGGFGPGGSVTFSASYATEGDGGGATYGNEAIIPLIGGSGGAGSNQGGGAGGGAIFIACAGTVTVNGAVLCEGSVAGDLGAGVGSGGAIRIAADRILGTGTLSAQAGRATGGEGRIRLEYVTGIPSVSEVFPSASTLALSPGAVPQLWPAATDPMLRIVSLNGLDVPPDPNATFGFPWQDSVFNDTSEVDVRLEGANLPSTALVSVFVTRFGGDRLVLPAGLVSSGGGVSTWQALVTDVGTGITAIQARAVLP